MNKITRDEDGTRRLRRRAFRGLAIQIVGTATFVVVAVVLGVQGTWAGAVVFGFLALLPLGEALAWRFVLGRLGSEGRERDK